MSDKRTVIALGYFDSVHKGHRLVLDLAKQKALQEGANFVVFTFESNVKAFFSGEEDTSVYTAEERLKILTDFGADQVFFAPVTKEFLSLTKREFLDYLNQKYNICHYVSGADFKFGAKGAGDKEYLAEYAKERNQTYTVADTVNYAEKKISTTRIKALLAQGNVASANQMLDRTYSVSGEVFSDRKVGKKLGFPTLNIKLSNKKFRIADGVYKGHIRLEGKVYSTIINYGARPTFGLDEKVVEAHVIGFNGDLYGKRVTLYFDAFMRKIFKFERVEDLKKQLNRDLIAVTEGNYD